MESISNTREQKTQTKPKQGKSCVKPELQPLPYKKIKKAIAIWPVRIIKDTADPCQCDPKTKSYCAPPDECLNRELYTECNPDNCPAGIRCQNQRFDRLRKNKLEVKNMGRKGFGLITLEDIQPESFIIEFVGELINQKEKESRLNNKLQATDMYILKVDCNLFIDSSRRGNESRFVNHSCEPNCTAESWIVNGNKRIGLFSIYEIPANTELTMNYGTNEEIECFCEAEKCAGFIGAKYDDQKRKISCLTIEQPPTELLAGPQKRKRQNLTGCDGTSSKRKRKS